MDRAKPSTDATDVLNELPLAVFHLVCGREAYCEGRSALVRTCGPRSNENPAGSSNQVG